MNISVIITCHNEEEFIERCIRSVLNQTIFEKILEIIVILDSSTDNSEKIINELYKKCLKIKIIKSLSGSLSNSRNKGLNLVSGEYVAILDGDDYWLESKLENQLKEFKVLDNTFGMIYTNYIDLFENGEKKKISVRSLNNYNQQQLKKYFCDDGPIVPSTILVKKKVFDEIGKFDENLKYYEDTDFFVRLLENYKVYHLNDFSCVKQRHKNQITNKLYNLINHGDKVIFKSIKRNKILFKLKNIRMARNRNKAAIQCITFYDEKSIAYKLILQSLKLNFLNIKTWIILLIIIFPKSFNLFMINKIKQFININVT